MFYTIYAGNQKNEMKKQQENQLISTELDLLLIQINKDLIPITQSRIIVEQINQMGITQKINFLKGENIHFSPQDRLE
ncbi:unnamed protein product [Paramecium sonneborni]|uniref:Uncharacterized protein n=1 Tax=Paramecium sonneborni TaxID=65129 RepID=A0A8S1KM00_9CILI|nr:unnamed protein product [Paramecium sonneborni]